MIKLSIDVSQFDNPIHRGMHVLKRLQQAGVPVVGILFPEGVTHGTLLVGAEDLATGEVLYAWDSSRDVPAFHAQGGSPGQKLASQN